MTEQADKKRYRITNGEWLALNTLRNEAAGAIIAYQNALLSKLHEYPNDGQTELLVECITNALNAASALVKRRQR